MVYSVGARVIMLVPVNILQRWGGSCRRIYRLILDSDSVYGGLGLGNGNVNGYLCFFFFLR